MLDTAIRLLDAEGVEALTMRRLASELGVSAMAPYRHVGSKDELLMVLVDRIYDSLAEHPWVPEVLARRRMLAPSVLGAIEDIHAALRDAGLSIEAALRAAPDPERYPLLAKAAAAWTAAHDRDTYSEDLGGSSTRCWRMRATPERCGRWRRSPFTVRL